MEITWAIAILILGAIAGVGAIAFAKKKSNRKMFGWIGGIALVLGLAAMSGYIPQLEPLNDQIQFSTTSTATPGVTQTTSTICAVEDTTVTLSALNKYTAAATSGTHRYRIDGGTPKTVSDLGTFTASPGDKVEILFENAAGSYFSVLANEEIPCKGTVEYSADAVQNGTVTIEVFNEEGNLIDTSGENETLAAGDVVTLEGKIKGTFQRGIPYGGIVIVEYNDSEIDDLIVDFGGKEVAVPSVYTPTFGAESGTKAYSVPAILSNQILTGSITIDADDTNNPTDASDPVLEFRPNNYYLDEDNGGKFSGPAIEDEDDAATIGHTTSFTLSTD